LGAGFIDKDPHFLRRIKTRVLKFEKRICMDYHKGINEDDDLEAFGKIMKVYRKSPQLNIDCSKYVFLHL